MRTLALTLFVLLGAAPGPIERSYLVTVDDKPAGTVIDGKEIEFACAHAEGKKHVVRIRAAKQFVFRGHGVEFPYPSDWMIFVEKSRDQVQIKIDDPTTVYPFDAYITPLRQAISKDMVDAVLKGFKAGIERSADVEAEEEKLDEKMGEQTIGGKTYLFSRGGQGFISRAYVLNEGDLSAIVVVTCTEEEEADVQDRLKDMRKRFRLTK